LALVGAVGTTVDSLENRLFLSSTGSPVSGGSAVLDHQGTLTVVGTAGNDQILVSKSGATIKVRINSHTFPGFAESAVKRIVAEGLAGNDTITISAGNLPAVQYGGPGNDVLTGGQGPNSLFGGAGDDDLRPGAGPSNDIYGGDTTSGALDGLDTVDYSERSHGMEIHLDGLRDSGMSGEHDLISPGIQRAYGSQGNDIIFANPNGVKDALYGLGGNDTLYAGSAPTALYGGNGNDLLNSRDNVPDYLDGGAGTDTAHADLIDQLLNVENVQSADTVGGGTLDASFGTGGYLNFHTAQMLLGPSIVVKNTQPGQMDVPPMLASPDGQNVRPYNGPLARQVTPNFYPDGRYLLFSNGVLTRYNANDTVDTTFGNNGSLSNIGDGNPDHTFVVDQIVTDGPQIYIAGRIKSASAKTQFPALARITDAGAQDTTFGDNGIAKATIGNGSVAPGFPLVRPGLDGEIYVIWYFNQTPTLVRFAANGALDGTYSPSGNVSDMNFQGDGKILILTLPSGAPLTLTRLDHDLTLDPSFGQGGVLPIEAPFGQNPPGNSFGTLLLRADGEIIVGAVGNPNERYFTVALRPDVPAGSGSVSGRFFNDRNGSGTQNTGEPGLAYWQAYADVNHNGVYDTGEPSGIADVAGNFAINGLAPGSYTIGEVPQDGWTPTASAGQSSTGFFNVTVTSGLTTTGANFGNQPASQAPGSITGMVFNDINGNRSQDFGEPSLAGWQVYVDLNDNGAFDKGEPIATTDQNGHYTISGLPPGGYLVREIIKSGWVLTWPLGASYVAAEEVSLAPGENAPDNDFANAVGNSPLASIFGVIYDDFNNNGKADFGEPGIAGLQVHLLSLGNQFGSPPLVTTTAADGSYAFDNVLPGGSYYLSVYDPNTGWNGGSSFFQLLPSEADRQDLFDPPPGVSPPHVTYADPSFGDNGYLTGYRAVGLLGGSIVAADNGVYGEPQPNAGQTVLSSPDGRSVQPYNGPIPQPAPTNVQSDGKYLTLANGVLTRYNRNGTVDTTFGNGGSVSNFNTANSDNSVEPVQILVSGMKIYLAVIVSNSDAGVSNTSLERLTPNGSLDSAFGDEGIVDVDLYSNEPHAPLDLFRVGPDGDIYEAWDDDDAPGLTQFTPQGQLGGSFGILDAMFRGSMLDMAFQPDGKILLLAVPNGPSVVLYRFNHDLTPDLSFGKNGAISIQPQFWFAELDDLTGETLLLRADGEIIVGIAGFDRQQDFTIAFAPDIPAGSGTASGRFFNDLNGNRKQDAGEPGLAYWQAYADLNNNGVYDAGEPSGFADTAGNYSIKGLAPGTYIIREVRQDEWSRTTPAGAWPLGYYKVTVKANQTVTGLNFGNSISNHAAGSISGNVFNDINGNLVQDSNEPNLAGWQVYLDQNDNGVFDKGEPITTSDKNGNYVFSGLPVGGYAVREIMKSGWAQTAPAGATPPGYNEVNLAPGEHSAGNDFGDAVGNSPLVSVSGFVFNDINSNGRRDPGENGIGGISISLVNTSFPDNGPWISTATKFDGSFSFDNVAPGTYYLEAWNGRDWDVTTEPFTLLPSQSFRQNFFDNAGI
jgi:uncharacterized delta-60 repeat protein